MIDIKTLAFELDVSRTTIYNHINKNNKELQACILKKQGVTFLTEQGVRIIKESMGIIKVPVIKENIGFDETIEKMTKSIQVNLKDNIESSIVESMKDITEDIKESSKKDYEKLELEITEVKKQNELLINLLKEQNQKKEEKKSIFDIFKRRN